VKYPFHKIIFHSSECFGTCPVYHLEVDSDKTFKLIADVVYKKDKPYSSELDSSMIGHFKGTVNDTIFNKLIKQIKTSGIDTLNFGNSICCDGSLITIIIYHDGKRRYIQSMFLPDRAWKFASLFVEICQTNKMERTNEKFTIEYPEK
jgi:hypothetical protein